MNVDRQLQPDACGEETIAAFASALGGPIMVIRLSGARAFAVADRVWRGQRPVASPPHRVLRLGCLCGEDGEIDSQALAVAMPAPRSYTGEDMVELHCHGGVLGARLALQSVLRAGARHAGPGEFTRRAFVNGKMDLTQAEAVCDLITAHSAAALELANRQLGGRLGKQIDTVYDEARFVLGEIEARLDFPEEDLDFLSASDVERRLADAGARFHVLLASRNEGEILRHGVNLVIAGPPNVGKSSLMNAILGRDRAIVTSLPGTTRDTLEELAHIRGIPIRLVDTAGIRESADLVEKHGIARSMASLAAAQVALWIFDASRPFVDQAPPRVLGKTPCLLVGNKSDLPPAAAAPPPAGLPAPISVSALTGSGLDRLYDAIERVVWDAPHHAMPEVAVNARQAALLEAGAAMLAETRERVRDGDWELAAAALRTALDAIGRITGRTVVPDVLDDVFARFCIGK